MRCSQWLRPRLSNSSPKTSHLRRRTSGTTPISIAVSGPCSMSTRSCPRSRSLSCDEAVASGAAVVDTRPLEAFAQGHLAGSLSVSLTGRFAEQVGSVVGVGTSIVLVGSPEGVAEAKVRLARIGFDNVIGAVTELEALLVAHPARSRRLSRLTASELSARMAELGDDVQLIDVRNPGEVKAAPVDGARNIPLARLRSELNQLDPRRPVVLLCAGGARSAIASSVLWSAGFEDVSDVVGGANALGVAAACSIQPAP